MAFVTCLHSHDVDDQAEALNGFRQAYEQLGRGRFQGRVWQLMTASGFLLRESSNRSLRQRFSPPPEHVTLAVPLVVRPGSMFAGRPLARESLMVLTDQDEYELVSSGEIDLVGLSVHRRLTEHLAPAGLAWLRDVQRQRKLQLSPEAAAALRAMLMTVSAEAERGIDALADATGELELLQATLTQTVALAMGGARADTADGVPRRAATRLKVVQRAIDYLRANLAEDIGVPEICAAACASRRSLQYCFEEFLHTTPQAYLRAMRLNAARRSLKARGARPISELASGFGFASASHFTRHYKLMFGELPSETARVRGARAGCAVD